MEKSSIKILWVEDNIADILLIKEAFAHAGVSHSLNVINNGAEATDFLFRRGKYTRVRRPDLIILDLNLPRRNGREIVADIKTDAELQKIPLVVLTSSIHDKDILDGFTPERCLYIVKAMSFQGLVDMAKQIQDFWFSLTGNKET